MVALTCWAHSNNVMFGSERQHCAWLTAATLRLAPSSYIMFGSERQHQADVLYCPAAQECCLRVLQQVIQ